MPEEQVVIVVAGKDNLSRVFASVGGEAQKAGQQIEKTLGKSLQETGRSMTDMGKKLSIGITAPLGIFAGVAVNAAIKSERLGKTLEGLAGGADKAAGYITAIKEASLGTIPKVEALAIANKALSFGIVKNTDEMAQLTQIAIALGRAQGLDATRAVSDLTVALSRQSPMILDNLGITLKLTEAYKIYGEKIGKSAEALSAEEKALAFREAALIKGMEVVQRMGGVQDDAAAAGERMKAQMSDLAVTVGTALLPVMQQGLDIIGPLIQSFAEASPAVQKLVIAFGMVAAGAGPALGMIGKLTGTVGGLMGSFEKAAAGGKGLAGVLDSTNVKMLAVGGAVAATLVAWQKYNEYQGEVAKGQAKVTDALGTWEEKVKTATEGGQGLGFAMHDLALKANESKEAFHADAGAIKDVGMAMIRGSKETDTYLQIAEAAEKAARQNAKTYDEYAAALKQWNSTVTDSRLKISLLADGEKKAAKTTEEMIRTHAGGIIITSSATQAVEGLTGAEWKGNEASRAAIELRRRDYEQLMAVTKATIEARAEEEEYSTAIDVTTGRRILAYHAGKTAIAQAEEVVATAARAAAQQEAAAGIMDRQKAAAEANTLALLAHKAASEEAARGQAGLMTSLTGATEAMYKQQLLSQIDPAAIGTAAWAELGLELGLLDEKAVNLAQTIDPLTQAMLSGTVPTDQFAELMHKLYIEAGKADPQMRAILDKFIELPPTVTLSADEMLKFSDRLGLLGEDVLPRAVESTGNYETAVDRAREKVETWNEKVRLLGEEALPIAEASIVRFADASQGAQGKVGGLVKPVDDLAAAIRNIPDKKTVIIDVVQTGHKPGEPIAYEQHGGSGVVRGPATFKVEPGVLEAFWFSGAMKGGAAAPITNNNSYGGDSYSVSINDRLAAALFMEQARQRRFERLNARM